MPMLLSSLVVPTKGFLGTAPMDVEVKTDGFLQDENAWVRIRTVLPRLIFHGYEYGPKCIIPMIRGATITLVSQQSATGARRRLHLSAIVSSPVKQLLSFKCHPHMFHPCQMKVTWLHLMMLHLHLNMTHLMT